MTTRSTGPRRRGPGTICSIGTVCHRRHGRLTGSRGPRPHLEFRRRACRGLAADAPARLVRRRGLYRICSVPMSAVGGDLPAPMPTTRWTFLHGAVHGPARGGGRLRAAPPALRGTWRLPPAPDEVWSQWMALLRRRSGSRRRADWALRGLLAGEPAAAPTSDRHDRCGGRGTRAVPGATNPSSASCIGRSRTGAAGTRSADVSTGDRVILRRRSGGTTVGAGREGAAPRRTRPSGCCRPRTDTRRQETAASAAASGTLLDAATARARALLDEVAALLEESTGRCRDGLRLPTRSEPRSG